MKNPRWSACWLLLIACYLGHVDSNHGYNRSFFLSEIFNKYGNEDFMTYEGFEHLLENLGLGRLKFDINHDVSIHRVNGTFREFHDELKLHKHDHDHVKKHKIVKKSLAEPDDNSLKEGCLTPEDLLATYGFDTSHGVVISQKGFFDMCPAIVYELDHKSCWQEPIVQSRYLQDDHHLVWVYASLTIFVMSFLGLVCILFVPLVRTTEPKKAVLDFFVAVGAGTLCGDAILHLLPHALSNEMDDDNKTASAIRGTVTLFSIILFYFLEATLTSFRQEKNTEESHKMMTGQNENVCHGEHHQEGNAIASMIIIGDILHNIMDGLSIGAAFSLNIPSGFASAIAIFSHELPHELGDYATLLSCGMSRKKALLYNIISSVFSFVGMVTGVLLGEVRHASLWINAFTAGSFLYIALSDLVPEMKLHNKEERQKKKILVHVSGLLAGTFIMLCVALYEEDLEILFI